LGLNWLLFEVDACFLKFFTFTLQKLQGFILIWKKPVKHEFYTNESLVIVSVL
jgi:hypothetical protein